MLIDKSLIFEIDNDSDDMDRRVKIDYSSVCTANHRQGRPDLLVPIKYILG